MLPTRFTAKIRVAESGCWEWQGHRQKLGYGTFQAQTSKSVLAHRFAYESIKGKIPEGLCLDHICRNRRCVNPEHLEAVTHAENVRRSPLVGKHTADFQKAKTHCPQGHPYSGENLWITPDGKGRRCRECGRINAKHQSERRRRLRNGQ